LKFLVCDCFTHYDFVICIFGVLFDITVVVNNVTDLFYTIILNVFIHLQFLRAMGVPEPTQCVDIYGFDDDLLAIIPTPIYAVLFVFPDYRRFDELYRGIYEKLVADGAKVSAVCVFGR
jgi:hypothetical protein